MGSTVPSFDGTMLTLFVVFVSLVASALGHGMMHEPPSRQSAWRHGFDTPINFEDNELFCGGFEHQWHVNAGKCGICGDKWEGPRENEAGGKYATGTITRTYRSGQVIDVTIELTANHEGYLEWKLCPNNDVTKAATPECLDRNVLQLADGSGTRYVIKPNVYHVKTQLKLPEELECDQCVLQWKYNAGNKWGVDPVTLERGLGFGAQEQFYACADVAIHADADVNTDKPSGGRTTTAAPSMGCKGAGNWAEDPEQAKWCDINCKIGHCPESLCVCP